MTYTVGVDVGGTKIAAGVVDPTGRIIAKSRKATPVRDVDAVVEVIVKLVGNFQENYELEAVGVGCAGLVDAARSKVILAPNLGWTDEPLRMQIERAIGLPTVIENDANSAAWGEFRFGAGKGHDDLVMVTVGTGIGGGVILGGRLQRGASGVSGEFGHLRLVPEGRLCGCGRNGCWEQYASGNALVRIARDLASEERPNAGILLGLGDGTPEGVQGPHVTQAALQGDPVALEAFEILGEWLARGLCEVATLLDPAAFVVGGGVVEAGDLLLEPTKREFAPQLLARAQRKMTSIVPAVLGNLAGLVGAADLARDHGPTPEVLVSAKAAAAKTAAAQQATSGRSSEAGKAKKPRGAKPSGGRGGKRASQP